MNSDQIYEAIEEVAGTLGKNDKEALLKRFAVDPDFRQVLEWAYSPFETYGMRPPVPTVVTSGDDGVFDAGTWEFLHQLTTRDLAGQRAEMAYENQLKRLSAASGNLLWRIIRSDLRAGFSGATCNKVWPKLVPESPYMRCCLPKDVKLDKFDWATGVLSQEKADGMFANVDVSDYGEVRISSRQGQEFPQIGAMRVFAASAGRTFNTGTQTHGELLVTHYNKVLPREVGNGILNSLLQGGELADGHLIHFLAWDQIPLTAVVAKGKHDLPYSVRFEELSRQTREGCHGIELINTRICHSLAEAYDHYRELLKVGKEGVVIKNPHAIWKDGTSKEQVKLKLEVDVDLKVVGFLAGEGKNAATFGSVMCETACGALAVSISGFTDAKRQELWDRQEALIGTVMTVKANAVMRADDEKKHSLFLPRFVECRSDKTQADDLASVIAQFANAVEAA